MSERGSYSPARWHRLRQVFYRLTVPKCEECGKGHIPERLVCPDKIRDSVPIQQSEGEIYSALPVEDEIIPS